ncbi:MAG TPA: HD domain-containing phosphohydrolase [Thermodesulfobacteriota bacterium]|jgi:putative nucleotidyltransferase with HDIG domain|nr:HD domain-containing phosphohydrolase [Thermodesulfobacteriota bacterium]
MEQIKQYIMKHFEKVLVAIIFVVAFFGTYFIEEVSLIFNFYYLPVLIASYFLGRRIGILVAILSILDVLICAMLFPNRFFSGILWHNIVRLSSWSVFLFLASVTVGTLYEQNDRRLSDLKNAYIGIIEILAKYLESTDRYTKGHSIRVSELAMEVAIAMELPRTQVDNIRAAGLLHDIGKIEISADVLGKAAALTSEEKALMDSHAVKGAYLLSSVGSVLKEVVPIVVAHHKYFMDTIEGSEKDTQKIPLGARIVAVADAFDAMVTDRPYRKGMQPWNAVEEIIAKAGKQFDPEVVNAFKRVISQKIEGV